MMLRARLNRHPKLAALRTLVPTALRFHAYDPVRPIHALDARLPDPYVDGASTSRTQIVHVPGAGQCPSSHQTGT